MDRFQTVDNALIAAKQAVHDLEAARWILMAHPLTFAEGDEVNTLETSAKVQLRTALQHLEPK